MLNYLATHDDAKVRFYASDMVLNIHSNASYLTEPKAKSRLAGYFFLGSVPVKGQEIKMNGNILLHVEYLKYVL